MFGVLSPLGVEEKLRRLVKPVALGPPFGRAEGFCLFAVVARATTLVAATSLK